MNWDTTLILEQTKADLQSLEKKMENVKVFPFSINQPPAAETCKHPLCYNRLSATRNRVKATGYCIKHLQYYLKKAGKK